VFGTDTNLVNYCATPNDLRNILFASLGNMDDHGKYLPLDSSKRQIRLLTLDQVTEQNGTSLQCTLQTASLNDQIEFVALSYCWGDYKVTRSILVNGTPRHVSENLAAALNRLHSWLHGRQIWVDALCIDQENHAEKNVQVPLVKAIYTGASLVYVWLGESNPRIDEFAQGIAGSHAEPARDNEQSIQLVNLAASILLNTWWERMWVVQEFVLPLHELEFICGEYKWPWASLWSHMKSIISYARSHMSDEELTRKVEEMWTRSGEVDMQLKWHQLWLNWAETEVLNEMRSGFHNGIYVTIQSGLIQTRRRSATVLLDKIYALLGMMSDADRCRLEPLVNYDVSVEKLCQQVMMTFWDQCNLINLMSLFNFFGTGRSDNTPSWVLDFSCGHPHASAFLPQDSQPDVWRATSQPDLPLIHHNHLFITWPGQVVDRISSCCHIPTNAQHDSTLLMDRLLQIRDDFRAARSRRTPQPGSLQEIFASTVIERETFAALVTHLSPEYSAPGGLDERLQRYLDHEWALDFIAGANPGSADAEVLERIVQRADQIPNFMETYRELSKFVKLVRQQSLELTFFTTPQGYIGFSRVQAQPNDIITFLQGAQGPILLRVLPEGRFSVAGLCYVSELHGWFEGAGFEDRTFLIC
jgi:hypothetical protein